MLRSSCRHLSAYIRFDTIKQNRVCRSDRRTEAPFGMPSPAARLRYCQALRQRSRAARPRFAADRQRRCRLLCFKPWQGAALQLSRLLWAVSAVKNVVLASPARCETELALDWCLLGELARLRCKPPRIDHQARAPPDRQRAMHRPLTVTARALRFLAD